MTLHLMNIKINNDDILQYIYSYSAYHAAHNSDATKPLSILTPDNEKMLNIRIEEAFNMVVNRLGGYINTANYNSTNAIKNIAITFQFKTNKLNSFQTAVQHLIRVIIANYVLSRFYDTLEKDNVFEREWRRLLSQVLVAFSHDVVE